MKKKDLKDFVDGLDSQKEKVQIESGTIWLKSYQDFEKVSEFYANKLVKPFHAAKMLGVTKTQILRLEREGRLKTFRMEFTDDVWKTVPLSMKMLVTKSDIYVWIPLSEIEAYAEQTGKDLKAVRSYFFNEFLG
ncbi:MAG: hypothetical protein WCW53_01230 [Syntrophales bacterium]|jgi:hypothetical protein